jgi:putative transposase
MAFRAYQYALSPTVRQRAALERLLDVQRELYNAALQERRGAWAWERRSITRFEQYRTLTTLRAARPDVLAFGVTVCRGTLARLDEAFTAFYRRARAGDVPGPPRFKSASRWSSVQWSDSSGWGISEASRRLHVRGIGEIKLRLHRPIRGVPKTLAIRRDGGRWFVTVFCSDVPAQPLPPTGNVVGIDLGVAALVATSAGELVANPRHARRAADDLRRLQSAVVAKRPGSVRRRRASARVAAVYRKSRNQRRDHLHKVSRRLVDANDIIIHEDLAVAKMVRRPAPRPNEDGGFDPNGAAAKGGLNKSIHDASWGLLLRLIAYKAEDAGREVVAVDPRHTSQTCAACGHLDAASRPSQADFRCTRCGQRDHADLNAAKVILRAGQVQRAKREANRHTAA